MSRISRVVLGCLGVLAIFIGIPTLIAVMTSWDSTTAGQVAVVRNGGPVSNKNIRKVIDPGSGLTWTGAFSSVHKYPAQQRFYTITSAATSGDRIGVDVVNTPSRDGVDLGIEGTLYYQLNLDHKTLRDFDNKFGTRTFTEDGKSYHPYDGDKGWGVFLDQVFRPVLDNDLRQAISQISCADLVSSCSLVQNAATTSGAASPGGNSVNIAAIQDTINKSLATDLTATLGDQFFTGLRFNLVKISLPPNVQDAVNKAQAAYAAVSEAQAQVAQAKAQAQANEVRQQGYSLCPTCAEIDELHELGNVTVFAPGSGTGLPLTAAGK